MMAFIIPANDEFTIPRPPQSTNYAFRKITGECIGMVIKVEDARGREIPEWMTQSAHLLLVWDGIHVEFISPNEVDLSWKMD